MSALRTRTYATPFAVALVAMWPARADASFLHGDTLDAVADVLAWVVLVIVPVVGILVFWILHILPEKIAERKQHPQTRAIQTLCLLSLVFGGLLWPLAWLWAFTKPVAYKLAYGTDVDETVGHGKSAKHAPSEAPAPKPSDDSEHLRTRIAELEQRLAAIASQASDGKQASTALHAKAGKA
jgi:hypothetical protein